MGIYRGSSQVGNEQTVVWKTVYSGDKGNLRHWKEQLVHDKFSQTYFLHFIYMLSFTLLLCYIYICLGANMKFIVNLKCHIHFSSLVGGQRGTKTSETR